MGALQQALIGTLGGRPAGTRVLLVHADGSFADASGRGHTFTADNVTATGVAKFGSNALAASGAGATQGLVINGTTTDFAFGTDDFTIDFWIYLSTVTTAIYYDCRAVGVQGINPTIYYNAGLLYDVNGTTRITGPALSINTYYHIAVTRHASVSRMFLNGGQVGSNYADTNNYACPTPPRWCGATYGPGSNKPNCYADELRIIKGGAAWISNFTPPAAAYA